MLSQKPNIFSSFITEVKIVKYIFSSFILRKEKKDSQAETLNVEWFLWLYNRPWKQRVLIEVSVTVCNYFHAKLWHQYLLRSFRQRVNNTRQLIGRLPRQRKFIQKLCIFPEFKPPTVHKVKWMYCKLGSHLDLF